MLKFIRFILFPLLMFTFSCEKTGYLVTCSECTVEEPTTASLSAELDPTYWSSAVINIWEGNMEDSILIGSYQTYGKTFVQELTLNIKYTITATYHVGEKEIIAVDGATPRVRYDKSQCDEPCYFVYDRKCNLKLNYTH